MIIFLVVAAASVMLAAALVAAGLFAIQSGLDALRVGGITALIGLCMIVSSVGPFGLAGYIGWKAVHTSFADAPVKVEAKQ